MSFEEIIAKLRAKDESVTRCFFFWDGPTMARIEEIRRTDPIRASKMRKPICNTCRPTLLKVLHNIYKEEHFDYDSLVSDFYFYLIKEDRFSTIEKPEALMGWITTSAFYFFLNEKKKRDKLLENEGSDSLDNVKDTVAEDDSADNARAFVEEVLAAMPNRAYAKILYDVVLEVGQYSGSEKTKLFQQKADELGIPVDHLYVKVSRAKKLFKETAKRINYYK